MKILSNCPECPACKPHSIEEPTGAPIMISGYQSVMDMVPENSQHIPDLFF